MTAPTAASLSLYPGGLPSWGLLWLQNVLLVFVQLTTGATLYTGDESYVRFLTVPSKVVARAGGRGTVLAVHAVAGVVVVAVDVAFAWTWFAAQGRPVPATVAARPRVAVPTLCLVGCLLLMALLGASLYGTLRPNGPIPEFVPYAAARKGHRGLFAAVVALLGYHVFLTPRVSLVWTAWLRRLDPWGVVALAAVVVWGALAGLAALMLGEWATGDTFGRWDRDYTAHAAVLGGFAALATGVGIALGADAPLAALGATAGVALGIFTIVRRERTRTERQSGDTV